MYACSVEQIWKMKLLFSVRVLEEYGAWVQTQRTRCRCTHACFLVVWREGFRQRDGVFWQPICQKWREVDGVNRTGRSRRDETEKFWDVIMKILDTRSGHSMPKIKYDDRRDEKRTNMMWRERTRQDMTKELTRCDWSDEKHQTRRVCEKVLTWDVLPWREGDETRSLATRLKKTWHNGRRDVMTRDGRVDERKIKLKGGCWR